MNYSTLPPKIILELTEQSWYYCLQTLHTTLESGRWIRALLIGGENIDLCEQIAKKWLQITKTSLINTEVLASDINQGKYPNKGENRPTAKLHIPEPQIIRLAGVQASLLILSAGLNLWIKIKTIKNNGNDSWGVTFILDLEKIANLLATPSVAIALPHCSELTAEDLLNDDSNFKLFWLKLSPMMQGAFLMEERLDNNRDKGEKQDITVSNSFTPSSLRLGEPLFWESPTGIFLQSLDGGILRANPAFEKLIGYTENQLRRLDCRSICHPEDFITELRCIQQVISGRLKQETFPKRYIRRDGETVWAEVTICLQENPNEEDSYLLVFVRDLSYIRRAELELQQRRQWEALLSEIAATIRSTFNFPQILEIAVRRLQVALNTDRVVAYHLQADQSGVCAAEAVDPAYPSIWGKTFSAECIPLSYLKAYCQGRLWQTADIYKGELSLCHQEMLEEMRVRSMMSVPIQRGSENNIEATLINKSIDVTNDFYNQVRCYETKPLWGLIFVHHCRGPRQWTADEQQLVQAVANQVAIALEQSIRVQQLQAHTEELEQRVKQRTRSLERSLQFEQLIRNLTKTLHQEDVEEEEMLQAAVEGLVKTLGVDGCYAGLFDHQQAFLEVRCEYFKELDNAAILSYSKEENGEGKDQQIFTSNSLVWGKKELPKSHQKSLVGMRLPFMDLPDICRTSLVNNKACLIGNELLVAGHGEKLALTNHPFPIENYQTVLISPISDAQELIGAICVLMRTDIKPVGELPQFNTDEMQLVYQVGGQCAIAIRQSRTWRRLQAQNQELAALNRLKGELIANTSHELRTPLTAILGFSSVLFQECFGQLNSKQKEYVERISNSGQHLLEIINDILDLSRIEAGRLELEMQIIFLTDIVESAISIIQQRASEQGLNLEVELDPNLEYFVADPRRLKQMLLNLLSNAIKFTPNGTVGLKIYRSSQMSPSGTSEDMVNFLVWDTGIGISLGEQAQLFSPFCQIDSSLSRRYPGTGLGLAITRKLAELHGGTISLDSNKGEGARFTLSLPANSSAEGLPLPS